MADDTAQALDPSYDYAQLPDGSYAQFKKGTPPDMMRAKLEAKGLLKPKAQASPTQSFTPGGVTPQERTPANYATAVAKGVAGAAKGVLYDAPKYTVESAVTPPRNNVERVATLLGPVGLLATRMGSDIGGGVIDAFKQQVKAVQEGEGFAGTFLRGAENLPMGIGPLVQKAEEGGPHMFSPESVQAATEGAGYVVGPEILEKGVPAALKAESARLKINAAKLNNKVIRNATADARDAVGAGYQMAKERIIGGKRSLAGEFSIGPDGAPKFQGGKVEAARMAKESERIARGRQYDAQGTTVNGVSQLPNIYQDIAYHANQEGNWSPKVKEQVRSFLLELGTKTDPATGQIIPRNLNKMSVSDAIDLTRNEGLLRRTANWQDAPTPVRNLSRRILENIQNELPPDIKQLGIEEGRLIDARNSVRQNYANELNGKVERIYGMMHKGWIPFAVYEGVKSLGIGTSAIVGSLAGITALVRSDFSRTARAALKMRLAEVIDGAIGANTAPTGAPRASLGGQPVQGPNAPQVPVAQQLTGGQGPNVPNSPAGAATPPVAPATVVQQNPPPRGTMLPAAATRARAGSGNYVGKPGVKPSITTEVGPPNPRSVGLQMSPMAATQEALRKAAEVGPGMAPPPKGWTADRGSIPGEPAYYLGDNLDTAKAAIIQHENRFEPVIIDHLGEPRSLGKIYKTLGEATAVAEKAAKLEGKTIEGTVGTAAGAASDKAELSPEAKAAKVREQARLRQQKLRATSASQIHPDPGAVSGQQMAGQGVQASAATVASTAASAEQYMTANAAGYEAIAKLPGGQEWIDNYKKQVKALKMSAEQEYHGILEAADFFRKMHEAGQ